MKIITVKACKDCPYLRCPWASAIEKEWACGNSFTGTERPSGEEHWLGGTALPGDRIIKDINIIPSWCKLMGD